MSRHTWLLVLGLGLLLVAAEACEFSVSTANLSGLKIGKDKSVSQESSNFDANDTVYGVATVSNVPDKVRLQGRLIFVDVAGETSGPIPGTDTTIDLAGSGTATFTYTPPSSGWPEGKYKLEVLMLSDAGEQKDQKAVEFLVS